MRSAMRLRKSSQIIGWRDCQIGIRGCRDFVERGRQHGPVIAGKRDRRAAVIAKERDHLAVTRRKVAQAALLAPERFQRCERAGEARNEIGSDIELAVVDPASRIGPVQVVALRAECRQGPGEALGAGLWPRPAQDRALERIGRCPMRAERRAQPHDRMLEEGQQRDRSEARERRLGRKGGEHAGRRVGERDAAGLVDHDAPAPESGRDTARQRAVRCHQCGALARRLHRFAQRDRDRQRLLFGRGGVDHGDVSQRAGDRVFGKALLPALARSRRAEALREQLFASVRRRLAQPAHFVALDAEALQQCPHGVLRMPDGRRDDLLAINAAAGNQIPCGLFEVHVHARQHDGAVRQQRDGGEQRGGRRHRGGGTGGDHRTVQGR